MKDDIHKNIKYINNKLADENWVPLQINSLIREDNITMYVDCFTLLTAPVKIRILLGMLHLSNERLDRLEDHFRQLIEFAISDSDPWVKVTAGLLRYYPTNRQINKVLSDFPNGSEIIRQLIGKTNNSESRLLPLECRIVSKDLIKSICPSAPRNIEKHFQLKRKPKSAALRADLLQRSHEAANQNRKSNQNMNKLARQYSDMKEDDGSTPFMSIASQRRGHLQGRRQSSMNSREGGTKMIAINEAPTIKKEKKKKKKADKEAVSTDSDSETKHRRESQSSVGSGADLSILSSPKSIGRRRNSSVSSRDESGKKRRNSSAYDSSDSAASTSPYRGKKLSVPAPGQMYGQAPMEENFQPYSYSTEANYSINSEPETQFTPTMMTNQFTPNVPPQAMQPSSARDNPTIHGHQTDQGQAVQLTNDQMELARELFQYPRLSNEDKQVIIRFLAGHGQCPNPNPEMGNIHRYLLQEELQRSQLPSGQQVDTRVELLFQLNYETGQYEKLRLVHENPFNA